MNLELNITQLQSLKIQLHLIINFVDKTILDDNDLHYLAYFIIHGFKTGSRLILDEGYSLSKGVWANKMVKFRILGIIIGKGVKSKLNPALILKLNSFEYNLKINVREDI